MLFTTTGKREKTGRKRRVSNQFLPCFILSSVLNSQLLIGDSPDCGSLILATGLAKLLLGLLQCQKHFANVQAVP